MTTSFAVYFQRFGARKDVTPVLLNDFRGSTEQPGQYGSLLVARYSLARCSWSVFPERRAPSPEQRASELE